MFLVWWGFSRFYVALFPAFWSWNDGNTVTNSEVSAVYDAPVSMRLGYPALMRAPQIISLTVPMRRNQLIYQDPMEYANRSIRRGKEIRKMNWGGVSAPWFGHVTSVQTGGEVTDASTTGALETFPGSSLANG